MKMPRLKLFCLLLFLLGTAGAQVSTCKPSTGHKLYVFHAGSLSLSPAFTAIEAAYTCRTGVQVEDTASGAVDAMRQITAGGHSCDVFATADYTNIDQFLKPLGLARYNVVFAAGRMVLTYSAKALQAKNLPVIADPSSPPFHAPVSIPHAVQNWYQILNIPGVVIGGSHPFLDPSGYKTHMIFQLAEDFYKEPNLYDNLMRHLLVIPLDKPKGFSLDSQVDFQFAYEHYAQKLAAASKDGDFRYVKLPEEVDMSDFGKQSSYFKAMVVIPGLGVPNSPASVTIHGARVAWGITVMRDAAHPRDAVEFLRFLLGPEGRAILETKGPKPLVPALVSASDLRRLPSQLQPLVQSSRQLTPSSALRTGNPQ